MNDSHTSDCKEKHVELHDAIMDLNGMSQQLDRLIEHLEGPRPKPESDIIKETTSPSFIDVLNKGPENIREKTEEALKRIQQLTDLLF